MKLGSKPSPIWRGLCRIWPFINYGLRWFIGNGKLAKIWEDHWLGDSIPLIKKVICPILEKLRHARVYDLVGSTGQWK